MTKTRDTELAEELEALVAAKTREQRRMYGWFAAALLLFAFAVIFRHHGWAALAAVALSFGTIVSGVRAHLRASALRGQALEKILAEAFRRAGERPESNP